MSGSRVKRRRFALVTKFAFIIGLSIAISVFFVVAFNHNGVQMLNKQYELTKEQDFKAISNLIYSDYKEQKSLDGVSPEFKKKIKHYLENNLVLYVGVLKKATNNYIWSTNRDFDKNINIYAPQNMQKFSIKTFDGEQNTLVIIFKKDESILQLIELLLNGNVTLALTFIIFGVLSATLLAKQVTKPVEELVLGVWEFSKGNLEYRTSIKTDDEIGILAKAFNYMAEKLNDLYTSLEQKVQERTVQLSSKNEELNKAYDELKDAQALLVHNEKMRSLGELVAGVAHELNNPINFIYGNMTHLNEYTENLMEIISKYEEFESKLDDEDLKEIEDFKEEVEYDFIKEDVSDLIKSCIEGADRSKNIVLELKNFSRLDQGVVKEIDINESIDSTLSILNNKYKNKINLIKEYGKLPKVTCYAGQINQVFMNILDNAAQAIKNTGDVYIRTRIEENNAVIEIEDTGSGIDTETLPKIFDPFFTTKEVGSGTGLGLSVSYKIVKSHNGSIDVESEVGKGTKFTVKIPLEFQEQQEIEEFEEQNSGETEKVANE